MTLLKPIVKSFIDRETNTISHLVRDPASKSCAIIDPVLDIDMKSGRTCHKGADRIIDFIRSEGLSLEWILESHIHADHLTGAAYFKQELGGLIAVGDRINEVQDTWNSIFNYKEGMKTDPAMFDRLWADGERFKLGHLDVEVIHTPGHTAVDVAYIIGDAVFVGDTMFMPDYGTARTDFPGGDARSLYRSISRILALPEDTRVFMAHDYLPKGRDEYLWETTIAKARNNVMIAGVSEDEFVAARESKDKKLATPRLLYPSLQVNIRAGTRPPAEDNEISYIKVPLQ